MRTKGMFLAVALLIFGMTAVFAMEVKTEKIKVYGNCSMCKSRIEKAARSVNGVTRAVWNEKDTILTVTFDDTKTNTLKIEEAVAGKGHDTDKVKSADKTYKELPGCCQYDRPAKK